MTIQAYLAIIEERQPLNEEEIAMKNILVSGLINIETTASVNSFPIEYQAIDYNFFRCKFNVIWCRSEPRLSTDNSWR